MITANDDFIKFFKKIALDFFKEHELGLQTEYEYSENSALVPLPIKFLRLDQHFKKTTYKTDSEILANLTIDDKIYWKDYGQPFFKKLYLTANDEQRELIHQNVIILYSLDDFCEALSEYPNLMLNFVKKSKKNFNIIPKPWIMQRVIELWKLTLDEKSYNDLLLDYFTFYKKEGKKAKSRINMEFIFHHHVDDNNTFEQLKSLLPKVEQNNQLDIFNDSMNSFIVAVDKKKLAQYIRLENNDAYNYMHEKIATSLENKDFKNEFKIISISREEKYKSAKDYNFIVKVEKDSSIDKENFKKFLLSIYKEYEILFRQAKSMYDIDINNTLLIKNYFDSNMKANKDSKKIKI